MESRHRKAASGRFFCFFLESVNNGGAGGGGNLELETCFLCKRGIASDHHAYMYRGDAAFCSEDCRQEQMDMDAALAAVARRHRALLIFRPPSSSSRAGFTVHAPAVSGFTVHLGC
ncbi:FCS-Like Zinc finger 3-like [Hordeum vulgare subsp. vulgare]|uniref:FCS-Like Zinc finger 3-like n=1 Tax=Hordeum vulgare subsp. vulgare TaxID=112509 RepID=UPI001D1A45F2|nr:FCS-Like Zinc finger 3-like [Hordeum vulgare subsp. vulgare]